LVNSSLRQYVSTVREATLRFPYDDGAEDADFGLGADEVRAHLAGLGGRRILGHLLLDITIGDFHSAMFARP
jgi:hypothetical protein